jgi:hypothetical protein
MHDDHSSPREIVSQDAICVNGKILRCVQCDEPILDLQYAIAAHPGYDISKRIAVIVHEWCADEFDEKYTARRRRRTWWYMAPANDLVHGGPDGKPVLPFLRRHLEGTSREQRRRLQVLRGEL